jgi:hypothetical protein
MLLVGLVGHPCVNRGTPTVHVNGLSGVAHMVPDSKTMFVLMCAAWHCAWTGVSHDRDHDLVCTQRAQGANNAVVHNTSL